LIEKIKQHKYFILLIIAFIICQVIQLDGEWDRMDGDDAQYLLHARSLITLHQYNDPNYVYIPGATNTPKNTSPGWPLVLLPFVLIFGTNLLVLKILVIVFAACSGILIFKIIYSLKEDYWLSFLITAIYYFSMTTIVFSRVIYSEWPYLFISLFIIYKLLPKNWSEPDVRSLILTGFYIGISLLFRSIAISLILGIIALIIQNRVFYQRKLRTGIKWIIIVLIFVSVTYQAVHLLVKPEKGSGYIGELLAKDINFPLDEKASFRDIAVRIPKNGLAFIRNIGPFFIGRHSFQQVENISLKLGMFLNIVLFGFILAGFISRVIKRPQIIEYYIVFYMSILFVIWFYFEALRYMMPVMPFMLFYFSQGVYDLFKKFLKIRYTKWILLSLLVLIFLFNIYNSGIEIYNYRFSSQNAKTTFLPYKKTVEWLCNNIQSDELIIADDARWYALETGLPVTTFLRSRNIENVYEYIKQFPKSIIVYDERRYIQKKTLLPVLKKFSDQFNLAKKIQNITIYKHHSGST
jgi:hypothetical protein